MATARKPKKTSPARPAAKKEKPAAPPLGRYLRRFTLQNVRTFRSPVTLDFCREDGSVAQWTVILGENGTGKTTLLQYLAGMMPTDRREWPPPDIGYQSVEIRAAPRLANESWNAWHFQNVTGDLEKGIVINARLEFSTLATNLVNGLADAGAAPITLHLGFIREIGEPVSGNWEKRDQEFEKGFRLFAYGANRHIAGPASPYLSSQTFFQNGGSEPANTLYHDDHPLISPEQWLLGLDHASHLAGGRGEAADRVSQSVRRCLRQTLPEVRNISVKPLVGLRGQAIMTLMFQTVYGEVPFGSLSLGYRTMAAWLTDFVKRMHEAFPDLDEPDNGPAIVLIDEFDLHLHPRWQRSVMESLSKEFPNTQFIVTAHSPLIVQATEGHAKLIVLKRKVREDNTEEVEVINDPHYAAGWRVDQILASDLYDLSPRAPTYAALMEERVRLRQREKRTVAEEQRLETVEAELDRAAPPGVSVASEQLVADLRRALERAEQRKQTVGK